MAKTAATNSRSPFSFLTGDPITKGDLKLVHEAQNYARCQAVQNLVCGEGVDGAGLTGPSPHGPIFWPASGTIEVYRFDLWIDPDLVTLNVRTVASMPGGGAGSVTVTIGSGSCTNAHAAASTTTTNGTIATSASGTGWQLCTVELNQTSGDPSSGTLDRWRVRSAAITVTGLPDPA